jgi:hypothetical protein
MVIPRVRVLNGRAPDLVPPRRHELFVRNPGEKKEQSYRCAAKDSGAKMDANFHADRRAARSPTFAAAGKGVSRRAFGPEKR